MATYGTSSFMVYGDSDWAVSTSAYHPIAYPSTAPSIWYGHEPFERHTIIRVRVRCEYCDVLQVKDKVKCPYCGASYKELLE